MSIFNYSDYKAILKARIAALPHKGRGEINRISESLGVHATLISQVLNGAKHFMPEQGHKLCIYLGLQPLESDYFILLLLRDRAGNKDFRDYYVKKIEELKKSALNLSSRLSKHRSLSDYERSVFYSSYIYSAIRLFTSIGEGQSVQSVADRFFIARSIAAEILNFLTSAQLCSEENGLYKMKAQHTHLEFGSPFLSRHHCNWRLQAMQRADSLSEEELMFTAPMSLSLKDFSKIRENLVASIKSTSEVVKDSPAEELACLNIDLVLIKK